MKKYDKQEYVDKFGEKMWNEKVEKTLSDREKKIGIESVYATDMGNIFIVNLRGEKG